MSTTFSGGHTFDGNHSSAAAVAMGEHGWCVVDFGDDATNSLADVVQALRNLRPERAAIEMLNIDDDYFILMCQGVGSLHVALSDAAAAVIGDIAADVFDELDLNIPDFGEDKLDDVGAWVGGDIDILVDLGCSEKALEFICDDQSLWVSKQLLAIAEGLGCAEELADVADLDYDGDDDDYDSYDD